MQTGHGKEEVMTESSRGKVIVAQKGMMEENPKEKDVTHFLA